MNQPIQKIEMLELAPVAPAPAALPAATTGSVVTPADLLRVAFESNDKDLERLERLMAMDERYRESQERERQRAAVLAFKRDFASFRGENIIIPKTKSVDRGNAGSFMQAEYDEVCRRLSSALSRHGFSFRHDQKFGVRRMMIEGVESDVGWVWVTCYLEHREGHSEKLDLDGPPGDMKANTPVQNMQVTASYLKRQSLLAITGTATGGEDDESRLRQRGASQAAQSNPDEELIEAGQDAAMNGMKALTAWWGALTAKERGRLSKEFAGMRRCAMEQDAGGRQ